MTFTSPTRSPRRILAFTPRAYLECGRATALTKPDNLCAFTTRTGSVASTHLEGEKGTNMADRQQRRWALIGMTAAAAIAL
ncbi:hypothetical protein, partial [Microbacterium sp. UBA6633]|uniref:hypothetical protein n=1 Tax=Microbacterium sp. UBA6633 TaxID=1946951 RepID=UPI0025E1B507